MSDFVHLHVHTSYSFLDGYNPINKLVSKVKNLGMSACAITDHNHLGGIPEFQQECLKQGIKPILGIETYYTWDMNECSKSLEERQRHAANKAILSGELSEDYKNSKIKKKEYKAIIDKYMYDTKQYHLILLAMNQTGWNNLVKIQSEAAKRCTFNGRFLCDDNLLRKYNEGIICTTACIASASASLVLKRKLQEAEELLLKWKDIFKDRLYLEIQPLDIYQQHIVNQFYLTMYEKHNIKPVATNDVHWTNYEDYDDHDTLLCIGTGKYKSDTDRLKYSNDFWLKSEEEMIESFEKQMNSIGFYQEYKDFYALAIQNTKAIADRIEENIRLGSDKPLFSKVKVPNNNTPEQYLTLLAWQGLYKYLAKHKDYDARIYEQRLYDELNIINTKGFAPYMLAVREYINWANSNNIMTGPGRGSAAGSLVLFSLGITKNIDPIKYNLLFSRFLTKDRNSPPDIDVDISYLRRGEVIQHLKDYYGENNVAHIGSYSTMGVKSGIKDVGRVLQIPFAIVNNICKVIDTIKVKAQPLFKDYDDLKEGNEQERSMWQIFHKLEEDNPELFRLARTFEGTPRNFGIHASGILVTPIPITDIAPVRVDKEGTTITLYTGVQLEELNFIKYDLLGLKTLDIIQNTLNHINKDLTANELYEALNLTDINLYKYIADKKVDGVFQLESNLMKSIIDKIKPTEFNDIVAINAIARPGPISIGTDTQYANVKHGLIEKQTLLKGIDDIVDYTYGCILYQEQLMAISKRIAEFDDNQADSITRKILAKKKVKLFPMLRRCHIYGKRNCEGPIGWEEDNNAPWYDSKGKYGKEIKGALSNGYTVEELNNYFDNIEGFASYCFNLSHAAAYSYISMMSTYLKKNYPIQFMAALLSMTIDEKHKTNYINICEQQMNIKIGTPDINLSEENFTPEPNKNEILYGLSSIKGVGLTSIPEIINNRPYISLDDAINRIPKKNFNKKVIISLIKAGAFDFENTNRCALINKFYDIRNDNKSEKLDEDCDEDVYIQFETETLGSPITYIPWWDNVLLDSYIHIVLAKIISLREIKDKRGKLMAFVKLRINKCEIDATVFASKYINMISIFDKNINVNQKILVSGKKQVGLKNGETCLIINNATIYKGI